MALRWIAVVLLCALACGRPQPDDPARAALQLEDNPVVAGLPDILCLLPLVEQTVSVHRSLSQELRGSFNLHTLQVDGLTLDQLSDAIARLHPTALVLIDNRSLKLYRDYQLRQAAGATFPPALALMAAFGAESQRWLQNTSVITYQVPGVTGAVALRKLSRSPIHRVGVVFREPFARFIEDNRRLAKVENIELVSLAVPTTPTSNEVGWALDRLLSGKQKVDALWVVNDNILLSVPLLREVWLPATQATHVPVIVGVESLVHPRLDFGMLAVLPDPNALGMQAADYLFRLADANWQAEPRVEPPVAVLTVVDGVQADHFPALRRRALDNVDRVVR